MKYGRWHLKVERHKIADKALSENIFLCVPALLCYVQLRGLTAAPWVVPVTDTKADSLKQSAPVVSSIPPRQITVCTTS